MIFIISSRWDEEDGFLQSEVRTQSDTFQGSSCNIQALCPGIATLLAGMFIYIWIFLYSPKLHIQNLVVTANNTHNIIRIEHKREASFFFLGHCRSWSSTINECLEL